MRENRPSGSEEEGPNSIGPSYPYHRDRLLLPAGLPRISYASWSPMTTSKPRSSTMPRIVFGGLALGRQVVADEHRIRRVQTHRLHRPQIDFPTARDANLDGRIGQAEQARGPAGRPVGQAPPSARAASRRSRAKLTGIDFTSSAPRNRRPRRPGPAQSRPCRRSGAQAPSPRLCRSSALPVGRRRCASCRFPDNDSGWCSDCG